MVTINEIYIYIYFLANIKPQYCNPIKNMFATFYLYKFVSCQCYHLVNMIHKITAGPFVLYNKQYPSSSIIKCPHDLNYKLVVQNIVGILKKVLWKFVFVEYAAVKYWKLSFSKKKVWSRPRYILINYFVARLSKKSFTHFYPIL